MSITNYLRSINFLTSISQKEPSMASLNYWKQKNNENFTAIWWIEKAKNHFFISSAHLDSKYLSEQAI